MLRRRILALVALTIAPALAIQGYNEYALRTAREASVQAETLRAAEGAADDLVTLGENLRQVISVLSVEAAIRDKDPVACSAYLRAAKARLQGVARLVLTEPDGTLICNSAGSAPGSHTNAGRAYHRRALETGSLAIGDYVVGNATGQPSIHVAEPLRDGSGTITGVLVLAIDLDGLGRRLTRAGLAPDAAFSVLDSEGRVLVRRPDSAAWLGRRIDPDRLATIEANVGRARDTLAWDGRHSIVAIARPSGFMGSLTVAVGRDRSALFADIDAATRRGLILIGLGAALALAAAFAGSRAFIHRPVRRLLAGAAAWRRGDLTVRTGVSGRSEFGQLGEAFDGMAAELYRHEGQLRSEIARSHALQEQQATMMHELNHRVKNTLATVQSLARQSRGGEGQAAQLEARILALAKTHDLLTRDEWTVASLREVLENELTPYRNGAGHIALDGPDVALPPRFVLAIGMTVHELTTNAAKYGALSTPQGRVRVTWRMVGGEGGTRQLRLEWHESDGPKVEPPTRRGFGTRLIAGGIQRELDGEVRLDFDPAGLRCTLDVPLDHRLPDMLSPVAVGQAH